MNGRRLLIGGLVALGLMATMMNTDSRAETFTPSTGPLFNQPNSSSGLAINDKINQYIDNTQPGGTIRIMSWNFGYNTATGKLIDAYKRGVNIQVIINKTKVSKDYYRLASVIGTNINKPSFITTCSGGCRSTNVGSMHAKVYLFTNSGGQQRITIVGSVNVIRATQNGWNNMMVMVNNRPIYKFYRTVFDRAKTDSNVTAPVPTVSFAGITAYDFPRNEDAKFRNDPILTTLRQVRCTGVSSGYGFKGRTQIRVAMYHWADDRGLAIAKRLKYLDNNGCRVQVLVTKKAVQKPIKKVIFPKTSKGLIQARDAGYQADDKSWSQFLHHKYMIINGRIGDDRSVKTVFTGSQNWTRNGLYGGDETLIRIDDPAVHSSYNANWLKIWRNHSKPIN